MDSHAHGFNLESNSADTHDRPDPPGLRLDNSMFYKCYDALAEEIDENMVKRLKEHLDGLLIFAGLFAGVNSVFLALTLPLLKADPVDDTNALLLQNNALLLHLASGRNDTPPMSITLPSSTFAASYNIVAINILFSISLSFALISSFLAVFGRQWLMYYRKRGGGGPDRERWEQLKRYLGAKRWHLQFILDDILPSLLQLGLVIFSISLIIYLHTLDPKVSKIVGIPLYIGLILVTLGALCPILDHWCPFQNPFSRFVLGCISRVRRALGYRQTTEGEEAQDKLRATAIRRSISTSGDDYTLLLAAKSILTIESGKPLKQLWNDEVFRTRILELCGRARDRLRLLKSGDRTSRDSENASARVFRAVLAHMMLSPDCGIKYDFSDLSKLVQSDGNAVSLWLIPEANIRSTPAALVHGSLAFSLLRSHALNHHVNSLCSFLSGYSNSLARAGWNSLSLMVLAINLLVPDGESPKRPDNYVELSRLKQAYCGDLTVKEIEKAVSALSGHRYAKQLDCDAVLVNIMHSVAELVFDQNHPLHLRNDQKVTLLLLMERKTEPSLRKICSNVRWQMFTTVRNSFAVQAETRNSSTKSFRILEEFFRELRMNRPTDGSFNMDDQETLYLFEQGVLKDLLRYGFPGSRTAFHFRKAFHDMCVSYEKFKAEVYGLPLTSGHEKEGAWVIGTQAHLNGYQPPTVPMPGFGMRSAPVTQNAPETHTEHVVRLDPVAMPIPAVATVELLLNGYQPPTLPMPGFGMRSAPVTQNAPATRTEHVAHPYPVAMPIPAVATVELLPNGYQPPTIPMQDLSQPTIVPVLDLNVGAGPNGAYAPQYRY